MRHPSIRQKDLELLSGANYTQLSHCRLHLICQTNNTNTTQRNATQRNATQTPFVLSTLQCKQRTLIEIQMAMQLQMDAQPTVNAMPMQTLPLMPIRMHMQMHMQMRMKMHMKMQMKMPEHCIAANLPLQFERFAVSQSVFRGTTSFRRRLGR